MKAESTRPTPKKREDFIPTDCCICGQAGFDVVFPAKLYRESFSAYTFSARRQRRREHYQIVRCHKCGAIRSNPVLDPAGIDQLYQESEFIYSDEAPYAAQTYMDLFRTLVEKYGQGRNIQSIFEIGCGTGFFLEGALAEGVEDVVGFEPSLSCAGAASGVVRPHLINDVYKPELLQGRLYDAAVSFHVFDHLINPKAVLDSVAQALNEQGLVILVCHDVEALSAKVLGRYSPIFDVEHIHLFSKKSLKALLESAGFDVLEVGSLTNRYPLGYWLRMAPLGGMLSRILPNRLLATPISLRAGNLYAFGRRR